jgi:pyridoxal 5'-phosphate synthase pdxT subunit
MSETIGVLALQGCVSYHKKHIEKLGGNFLEVRNSLQLNSCDRLIIPGGESTTMLKLIEYSNLWEDLQAFVLKKPTLGICAGAILLAEEVEPLQRSFKAISLRAHRNYYGAQQESFYGSVTYANGDLCEEAFIRAPLLQALAKKSEDDPVACLARETSSNNPVVFRQRNILCSAFHSELRESSPLHKLLLRIPL